MSFSLKDYTAIQKLGEGGQGKVYRAIQISLKRKVVIKEMAGGLLESEAQLKWLEDEATNAASLEHDNIVRLYDFGYDNGCFYLVMEYVEGLDLSHLLALEKFPKEIGLMIMLLALRGLQYAHKKGIVHCDFKPNNILVSSAGRVTVTDFGMVYPETKSVHLTTHGTIFLTPAFMPPELATEIEGQGKVKDLFSETSLVSTAATASERIKKPDVRRDIWSTGVILYRILSGKFPFVGKDIPELVASIVNAKEHPLDEAVPCLPADLAAGLRLCLEKNPEKRLSKLDPLIESLERLFLDFKIFDCEREIGFFFADRDGALLRLQKTLAAYHDRKSREYQKSGDAKKMAAHFQEAEKYGLLVRSNVRGAKIPTGPFLPRPAVFPPLFTAASKSWARLLKSPVFMVIAAAMVIAIGAAGMKILMASGGIHKNPRPGVPRITASAQDLKRTDDRQTVSGPLPAQSAGSGVDSKQNEPPMQLIDSQLLSAGTDSLQPEETASEPSAQAGMTSMDTGQVPAARPAAVVNGPQQIRGILKVVITPGNALVYADEKLISAKEIAEGKRLKTGTHYVTAMADGYEPYWSSLGIAANKTRMLTIALAPVPENHGHLQIDVSPWSSIYVDGIFFGTTETLQTLALRTGEHFVALRRNGYKEFTQSVTISTGGTTEIETTLEPSGK